MFTCCRSGGQTGTVAQPNPSVAARSNIGGAILRFHPIADRDCRYSLGAHDSMMAIHLDLRTHNRRAGARQRAGALCATASCAPMGWVTDRPKPSETMYVQDNRRMRTGAASGGRTR